MSPGLQLLTVRNIAKRLDVSVNGVYAMIRRGAFPRPIKVGRLSRWPEDELQAWLSARLDARTTTWTPDDETRALTPLERAVLRAVWERGPVTAAAAVDVPRVSPHRLSTAVGRLQRSGMIEAVWTDAGVWHPASVTEAGRHALGALREG